MRKCHGRESVRNELRSQMIMEYEMRSRGHRVKTHYFAVPATGPEGLSDLSKVTKQMNGRDRARIQISQLLSQGFFCWAARCLSSAGVNVAVCPGTGRLTLLMLVGIGPPTCPSSRSTHIYRANIMYQARARGSAVSELNKYLSQGSIAKGLSIRMEWKIQKPYVPNLRESEIWMVKCGKCKLNQSVSCYPCKRIVYSGFI